MKKFIRISSLLTLLVLFTVISASAQFSGFGTDVEIPFAFNVGDRSYQAGNYIVKVERISANTATLSIQDTKSDDLQTVLLNVNGGQSDSETKLVFDTIDGKKYLTKVRSADKTYALGRTKAMKNLAKSRGVVTQFDGSTVLF